MKKKHSRLEIFGANPFVMFCVFFTISIAINIVIGTIFGSEPVSFGIPSLINIAIVCIAPIVPFFIFEYVPMPSPINDDTYSIWVSAPLHYLVSSGVILLALFIWGRFESVETNMYWQSIFSYTQTYVMIIVVVVFIDIIQTSTTNKNLRKIQRSQRKANKI